MLNINKIVENPHGDGHKVAPEKETRQKIKSRSLCSGPFHSALGFFLFEGKVYKETRNGFFLQ